MTLFHKEAWHFVGLYCDKHIGVVTRAYGTIKVEAIAADSVPLDDKCSIHACQERPCCTIKASAY